MLKAYLVSRGIAFGRTHNLEYLLACCRQVDKDFAQIEVGNLTDYAVQVRYPDDFYVPSYEEARQCYELALHIKEFMYEKLPELKQLDSSC
ncbi:HEPN domain-containing protein [Rhodothermus marinus]|uniref:HEPN domain-containing protein n=1 Tax=Rhodothermus marinus TaxID=29549 RepID=UPI0006D00220